MTILENSSIKIKNYKCIGEEPQGFEQIKPINIVIGKNNSGKSTLLDLVEIATLSNPTTGVNNNLQQLGHRGESPSVVVGVPLSEQGIRRVFAQNRRGGAVPGPGNHYDYGSQWIGKTLTYEYPLNNVPSKLFISLEPPLTVVNSHDEYNTKLVSESSFPFEGKVLKRLLADRDIKKEGQGDEEAINSDGRMLTNTFRRFLNTANLPSELIEETFLNELNKVTSPDIHFNRISVQDEGGSWEIYLHEEGKGRVPLSHTGSGLKTLILALAFIHIIPHAEGHPLDKYIFCLEELENNLHPSILRRLFLYIRNIAEEKHCTFFITTHSNVVIDLFSKDELAQIVHVKHDGLVSTAKTVQTYVEHKHVLDDLDIRASDLLQSNGIVWVEGPSDRLYFNRWIELATDGQLREGAHYQCVFYGGRLLAHLTGDDPDINQNELIKILRVNSNAILLIDSDAREDGADINATKRRLVDELNDLGGMPWVTHGKEIENYLPRKALRLFYDDDTLAKLSRNSTLPSYLEANVSQDAAKRFSRSKVLFAEQIAPHIDVEGMTDTDDLMERVGEAVGQIRRWNSIDE